ncbi:prephenate dehydrogenase [Leptotrichia sp. oral taxon 847]|uniref:prephenate dehydrogenase n=1 Tax=Leptotrichia sp. oral taxon 847 TaxID=1785996 RepID=UPI00076842F8|nr:prephenate dehydrogenase [Leptotrichia sp. oral taxon 847]AMD94886.1 prephenate dehydrogenase [Leptotrichia sp. oral taxon 847]
MIKNNLKNIEDLTVTVVGLGVIGGGVAQGLKNIGVKTIYGIDIDEKTLKKAKEKNIITKGFVKTKEPLQKSDFVVITLYPNIVKSFFVNNIENFKDGAIITDVIGIKGKIIEEIDPIIEKSEKNIDFIFGHPMAGREKRGIDFADSRVFEGANYILIKDEKNKKENLDLLSKIIKKMGFKSVSFLTAKEHDEIIAFTSQLTHAIAVSLVNSDNQKYDTNKFIGDSYRDLTRIAKINEDLWSELFLGNKENLLKMIQQFEDELDIIKDALKNDDIGTLKEQFIISARRREKID